MIGALVSGAPTLDDNWLPLPNCAISSSEGTCTNGALPLGFDLLFLSANKQAASTKAHTPEVAPSHHQPNQNGCKRASRRNVRMLGSTPAALAIAFSVLAELANPA